MAKCKRVLRCYHCGSVLQSANPKDSGFISPSSLKKQQPVQILYCDHCYEIMKTFNNSAFQTETDENILSALDDAIASDAIIVWVVDLFSFNGVLHADLAKKVSKLKVIVIGNKLDLLPDFLNKKGLIEYLNERFEAYGIKPYSIKLLSSVYKTDFAKLLVELNEARKGHDVYMIGDYASGKTTLTNHVLKSYNNNTSRVIKFINYNNSGLMTLEIPFSRSSFFYSLPGISNPKNVTTLVEKDVQKVITPKKKVKVSTKTMRKGETLLVGSLCMFSLLDGKPTTFKLYTSEGSENKKVSTNRADSAFKENMIKRTLRPVSDRNVTFLDFDVFEYNMENDNCLHDIAIEGLCWISFKSVGQVIRITLPKNASINESKAKLR